MAQEFDNYTRMAVYEAFDECGIYEDSDYYLLPVRDYIDMVRACGNFLQIDDSNYEEFLFKLIKFIEYRFNSDDTRTPSY